jgi:hypothetical protein
MEATYSSEMSADFQRTTRRYIPEDGTPHNRPSGNTKFYIRIRYITQKMSILTQKANSKQLSVILIPQEWNPID